MIDHIKSNNTQDIYEIPVDDVKTEFEWPDEKNETMFHYFNNPDYEVYTYNEDNSPHIKHESTDYFGCMSFRFIDKPLGCSSEIKRSQAFFSKLFPLTFEVQNLNLLNL